VVVVVLVRDCVAFRSPVCAACGLLRIFGLVAEPVHSVIHLYATLLAFIETRVRIAERFAPITLLVWLRVFLDFLDQIFRKLPLQAFKYFLESPLCCFFAIPLVFAIGGS